MIIYRCRRCGAILYVFVKVGQNSYGVPTPSEVASLYGGRCPFCGAKLLEHRVSLMDIEARTLRDRDIDMVEYELRNMGLYGSAEAIELLTSKLNTQRVHAHA